MKKVFAVALIIGFIWALPAMAAISDEQPINNSDNSDNSISIVVDGDNNLIIIANDGVTVAPPVDAETSECSGPAIYDVRTATFIVPNVKIVDSAGISTMFTRVVLGFDANGTMSILWVDQE